MVKFELPKIQGFTRKITTSWLLNVAASEGASIQRIHYKYFRSEEMQRLNQQFLQHDYDTDIISFAVSEHPAPIEADFALGWDQILVQSAQLKEPLLREIHRVLVHGLLHCIGYNDQSDSEQIEMRSKEDFYLAQHPECSTWNK